MEVKERVWRCKEDKQRQRSEWASHGRNLAVRDQVQRQRIKEVHGAHSLRAAERASRAGLFSLGGVWGIGNGFKKTILTLG